MGARSAHREAVGEGLKPLLPRLWRFGLSLTGDPSAADDLVQATCVRALERADQFEGGTRLDSWAFAIMASVWKNHIRAETVRRASADLDQAASIHSDLGANAEQSALATQVLDELQKLPDTQRITVGLVYIEGLTYKEAAETLGIPIGTVMSRLASARRALAHLNSDAFPTDSRGGHE